MTRSMAPAVAAAVLALTMSVPLAAETRGPKPTDLTPQFRAAGLAIDQLQVYEISGIVIIRGWATNPGAAVAARQVAQSLGYTRIADLVQLVDVPDDAAIQRLAERELTIHRSLDGCTFRVASNNGVVRLNGSVRQDEQRDVAVAVVRSLDGVRRVESNLQLHSGE